MPWEFKPIEWHQQLLSPHLQFPLKTRWKPRLVILRRGKYWLFFSDRGVAIDELGKRAQEFRCRGQRGNIQEQNIFTSPVARLPVSRRDGAIRRDSHLCAGLCSKSSEPFLHCGSARHTADEYTSWISPHESPATFKPGGMALGEVDQVAAEPRALTGSV